MARDQSEGRMSYTADVFSQTIRRVLLTQAVLTLIVAAGFWLAPVGHQAPPEGWLEGLAPEFVNMLSALYGGMVTMAGAWWLGSRVQRAGEIAVHHPRAGQMSLLAGAFARFAGAVLLMGVAFGVLKLAPIPVIVAFAAAQLGFLAGGSKPSA